MPEEQLKPAIRAALRMHEIGTQSPYKLYFAGKDKSGASFGFMQGDLAAGQPEVRETFTEAMAAAGLPSSAISSLLKRLSVHLIGNPLSSAENVQVNAALLSSRVIVDAMDEGILGSIYDDLDTCISRASATSRQITPEAQILMSMWVNMTGPPSKILTWIGGDDPGLTTPVRQPGAVIDGKSVENYLHATDYYSENPQNFPHLMESLTAGVKQLPDHAMLEVASRSVSTLSELVSARAFSTINERVAALALPLAVPDFQVNCYIYEQATGRMFERENGLNDLIATGYSGSEKEAGKNDPTKQCVRDIGPIPRGRYKIGDPFTGPSPFSLRLTPDASNEMCGRDHFLIHGDSIAHPGTASDGCIILSRPEREEIYRSKLGDLVVVERLG